MMSLWLVLLATGVAELETAPYEIAYHLVAELVTAIALLGAGVGLRRGADWAARLYPVALGMLGYTVVNSAGYYAERGEVGAVAFFTLLTLVTGALVVEYVLGRWAPVGSGP